jgi:hypothetical protein
MQRYLDYFNKRRTFCIKEDNIFLGSPLKLNLDDINQMNES